MLVKTPSMKTLHYILDKIIFIPQVGGQKKKKKVHPNSSLCIQVPSRPAPLSPTQSRPLHKSSVKSHPTV